MNMWSAVRQSRASESGTPLVALTGEPSRMSAKLQLEGLSCEACVASIEHTLDRLPGVLQTAVSLQSSSAEVTYDAALVQPAAMCAAIQAAGFGARVADSGESASQMTRLLVSGMTCISCSSGVDRALEGVPGVSNVSVSLLQQEARVEHDASVSPETLVQAVQDAGFGCRQLGTEGRANMSMLVGGMSCATCSGAVERALRAREGVASATVSLLSRCAEVGYDPSLVGPRDLLKLVRDMGFTADLIPPDRLAAGMAERDKEKRFWWRKFKWSCVFSVPVFLLAMVLSYVPGAKEGLETPVAGFTLNEVLQWALTTPVQFVIGWNFHVGAVRALRRGSANMDVLVSMGTNAAYIYSIIFAVHSRSLYLQGMHVDNMRMGFFETSALLITFISLGRALEAHARGKTSQAITELMNLTPPTAVLVTRDAEGRTLSEEEVPTALIQCGDLLKVLPGARIPADGLVVEGRAYVDEAMITGEPLPVAKTVGAAVVSGTVGSGGALVIQATRVGPDTTLARIVRLVERAQLSKAPIQAFADRISAVFVPLVLLAALATWLGWFIAGETGGYPASWRPMGSNPFLFALLFGITVLVIACPCALGLATPTAVMVGTGVAASHGILIKGADALEAASNLRIVVFDKTGTLTEGRPTVTALKMFDTCLPESEVLHLAAAGEAHSEHPLGRAILTFAREQLCIETPPSPSPGEGSPSSPEALPRSTAWIRSAHDVDVIPGRGVRCWVSSPYVINHPLALPHSLPSTPALRNAVAPETFGAFHPLQRTQTEPASYLGSGASGGPDAQLRVLVGNRQLLADEDVTIPRSMGEQVRRMEAEGATVVLVAAGPAPVAAFSVMDPVKPEAAGVIAALTSMNIACYMVTGDNWAAARKVAERLGITNVMAEALPEAKAAKVKQLQESNRVPVGMVGDGINDSPALAQADVGIAVGSGTDIAIEAADYVLMRNDLEDVLLAIHLSRRTLNHIYINYVWAMGYNTLMIPLAAGALYPPLRWALPPWLAGAAMAASSLCVVGCSLLLRRYKRPPRVLRSVTMSRARHLITRF